MEGSYDWKSTLYGNAVNMWLDYGELPPVNTTMPASEMRLVSGLSFSLHLIGATDPREGAAIAAVAGDPEELANDPEGVLVREHSTCRFSEFGDNKAFDEWLAGPMLRLNDTIDGLTDPLYTFNPEPLGTCDCRAQRIAAQAMIARAGGVYIDLAEQEGRGLQLDVKREIYRLHREEGLDSWEACKRLGVDFDVRRYGHCATFLAQELNIRRVRLLSNNPRKIRALADAGIEVIPTPLVVGVTDANINYLRMKRDKAGHLFPPDEKL